MSMDNKRKSDPRRVAMERTKVRSVSRGQNERKEKKKQDRLARQEQKMAEKMERAQQKAPSAPKKPTEKAAPRVKERKPLFTKESVRRVKEDFQVIVGGRRKKPFKIAGVLAVIVAVIIFINAMVPIGVLEYMQNVMAGLGGGDGFPISVSGGNNQLLSVGSDVALLNDSSLLLYKANGKLLFDRQHGYSDPAFTACSARVLVYDRGGKDLRVENRAKTLFTLKAKGDITAADMADNGTFAVVTRGSDYISDVTVYNAKAEEKFVWHSASRQITAVSLSDNGRYAAVATLHVEGGEAVTGLMMFDTKKGTTLFEEVCKGKLAVSLDCKDTTALLILTDSVVSVTKTGNRTDYSFEGGTLMAFDNRQSNQAVLVLGMYQDAENNRLLVLDKNLKCKGQADLSKEAASVSAKGRYITVLTDGQVLFYNRKAVLKKEVPLETDGKQLICKGNYAILLTSDRLEEIKK